MNQNDYFTTGNCRIRKFVSNMSERVVLSMYTREEFKFDDPLP